MIIELSLGIIKQNYETLLLQGTTRWWCDLENSVQDWEQREHDLFPVPSLTFQVELYWLNADVCTEDICIGLLAFLIVSEELVNRIQGAIHCLLNYTSEIQQMIGTLKGHIYLQWL